MTTITLMYVYFDKRGDIKAITPILDDSLSENFSVSTFLLNEVTPFLTAERNIFDYYIKTLNRATGVVYKIIKKASNIVYTRNLSAYLTLVPQASYTGNSFTIVNDIKYKVVSIEVDEGMKSLYLAAAGTEDEHERLDNFFNTGSSTIYLTEKNNPYHLLFTFSFMPRELLTNERLYFSYEDTYNNVSAYTKQLIPGYGYKEKVR